MVTVIPDSAPDSDVNALIHRVAELESTQRREDVDGFLALFGPSPVWVNGAGRRLVGLEEIGEFTRRSLPGAMSDGSVGYTVTLVRFLSADLALTGVAQEYVDLDGRPLAPRALGSPTYVWERSTGSWFIVAGQNTTFSTG